MPAKHLMRAWAAALPLPACLVMVFVAGASAAQATGVSSPATGESSSTTAHATHAPLERIEARGARSLWSMKLRNGLVAVIDARPRRRTVYCEIGVRVGSRNEPLELAGISHLLEHLLFKEGETPGSRKNPAFSRIRAAGGEVNASTSFERTNYFCDVHTDSFEEGWRGLASLVRAVGFDAKDVESERRVVLQEAALDKNNPVSVAAYSVLGRLFPRDPLGQPVIGFKKTLQRIRVEDATAYYRRFYTPDNSYALIVGDVDPEAAAALIEETLGPWERVSGGSAGAPSGGAVGEQRDEPDPENASRRDTLDDQDDRPAE